MLFKDISMVDENYQVKHNMYMGTIGDRIEYLSDKMPENPEAYGQVYEKGKNKLFIPGFFNSHTHTAMTLMRGYGENMVLSDWLHKLIFPFENNLTQHDVYWANTLGIAESLRFGIVCNTDMYMKGDALCKSFVDSGIKANVSIGMTSFDDTDYKDLNCYNETMEMIRNYNHIDNGRVFTEFSIHGEYTSNPKVVTQLAETAKEMNSGIHVHISETEFEHLGSIERHGKTPTAYLNDLGVFDVPTTAAHCVWVTKEDIQILADKKVTVATCPVSNLKLASGIAPIKEMLEKGINVALGTDSVSSNNSLNFIEEMKTLAIIQKVNTEDPTFISPQVALHAATRAGAIGTRRFDCGSLKVGNKADIVAIDIDKPHMYPQFNLLNNLVYSACGSDVFMTMIDGKILYEDEEYTTIDIEKTKYETTTSFSRIYREVNK